MSDLNWCTFCDNAISSFSNSLYCSEECLKADALNHHPLLGYDWEEFKDFPRSSAPVQSPGLSSTKSSPALSPVPSYTLPSPGLKSSESTYRATFPHTLSPPALELEPLSNTKPLSQHHLHQHHHRQPHLQKPDQHKHNVSYAPIRLTNGSPQSIFFM